MTLLTKLPSYRPYSGLDPDVGESILADGSYAIIGNDGMDTIVDPLNRIFSTHYPHIRFTSTMRGSATAIPALLTGASLFAPMSRDPWQHDRKAFREAKGYDPTPIRLGYTGHGPRAGAKTPPALYIHRDNPLTGLSMHDVRRIFAYGAPGGNITQWSQLGLQGDWSGRRIHLYGLRDDGKYATGFRDTHLAGRAFPPHYEPLANRNEVIRAVANDPFGIGSTGWVEAKKISDQVRIVPLSTDDGGPYELPDLSTVAAGGYPLKAWVSIFLDLPPDQKLGLMIKEYLALALSEEGQAIIAQRTHCEEGYVPLCREDWQKEWEKLQTL